MITFPKRIRKIGENRLDLIGKAHNKKKEDEIRTDRMEDHLEVIYELIQQKGYATTADISKHLNVSSPSVTKMVKKLDENDYLIYEKYRGLKLTGYRNQHRTKYTRKTQLVCRILNDDRGRG